MPTATAILQNWHTIAAGGTNKCEHTPVFSVDFERNDSSRLATGGADNCVRVWRLSKDSSPRETGAIEFLASMKGHTKSVNVVRFSPNGKFLASAGDDALILIWQLSKTPVSSAPRFGEDGSDVANQENWKQVGALRGHSEEIYDLSWSADSQFLLSGSMEKSALLFDVTKGKIGQLCGHNHNVQGVAWDPRDQLVTTLSSDRSLRIFERQKPNTCYLNLSKRSVREPLSPASDAPSSPEATEAPGNAAAGTGMPAEIIMEKKPTTQRLFAGCVVKPIA